MAKGTTNEKRAKNRNLLFAIVLMITFFASNATAGVPAVSDVTVTDVTTRSFSVVWISSESSLPDLIVYDDISGTVETADARITILPVNNGSTAIQNAAQNIGAMKVRVTGLDSNTTYYFQTITTSTASNQTACFPDSDPLLSVTTETSTKRTKIEDPDELLFQ